MKVIKTVCGTITPEKLGFTTMHEHTIADMSQLVTAQQTYKDMIPQEKLSVRPENMAFLRNGFGLFSDECSARDDFDWLKRELEIFRDQAGGNAVVDASPIPMRGDVRLMQKASKETGVHMIIGTGLYYAMGRSEEYRNMKQEEVYNLCKKEVEEGIDDSDIFPGFLKCGMSSMGGGSKIPVCEWETLRALAQLSAETDMSLHVHTAVPMTDQQILDVARCAIDCGCKPDRLLMMHLDQYLRRPMNIDEYICNFSLPRTINIDLQCRLLDMGCNIGFDSWDSLVYILPDNFDRLKALVELLRRGYGGQIVLGHDITDKSHSASYGYTGFTGFAVNAIPKLIEFSDKFDATQIKMMTYDNPARILAVEK